MTHATRPGRTPHDAAAFFVHFVHGSLLLTAFALVAFVGAGYLLKDPVSYADLGVGAPETVAVSDTAQAPTAPAPVATPRPKPVASAAGLSTEMRGVRDFVAQRYKISTRTLEPLLTAAELSGRKLGIDPLLIVAVMAIESSFNPFAESSMGAQGLMQVIPRFHLDKIGHAADDDALFDPMLNVHVGTLVLREGLQRFGSLQRALQYYGGALSDPNAKYANKVLAMKRRLLTVAGREAATGV